MYPPDTLDRAEHDASVTANADAVAAAWPSLVAAFGGSEETQRTTLAILAPSGP